MSITATITHITDYQCDKRITMGPQVMGLRPAPHSRTRILAFSQLPFPQGNSAKADSLTCDEFLT